MRTIRTTQSRWKRVLSIAATVSDRWDRHSLLLGLTLVPPFHQASYSNTISNLRFPAKRVRDPATFEGSLPSPRKIGGESRLVDAFGKGRTVLLTVSEDRDLPENTL